MTTRKPCEASKSAPTLSALHRGTQDKLTLQDLRRVTKDVVDEEDSRLGVGRSYQVRVDASDILVFSLGGVVGLNRREGAASRVGWSIEQVRKVETAVPT